MTIAASWYCYIDSCKEKTTWIKPVSTDKIINLQRYWQENIDHVLLAIMDERDIFLYVWNHKSDNSNITVYSADISVMCTCNGRLHGYPI